jgi:predicted RNA-binding protein with PUA-like domain
MQYWLIKSEPFKYSWDQFVADKSTFWDGVRNYQARNNMRAMQVGDLCLYYHSNEGKEIVGIAEVIKEHYQDPTTDDNKWVVVDVKPVRALKNNVTLAQMKSDARLEQMSLIRQMRLSVGPVTEDEFNIVMEMEANG